MNKPLIFLLLLFLFFSCKENSFDYKILQYEGTDSLNTKVVKEVNFNEKGLIISEKKRGFKTDYANSSSDINVTKIYKDSLLIKILRYYPNLLNGICCDSSRTEYKYNSKKLLDTKLYFDYKRILKKGTELKDNITSDDYEKERKWELSSKTFYEYDSFGRLIKETTPESFYVAQKNFEYNEDDKVIKESYFKDQRLFWVEKYKYYKNGYQYISTWYDYEGNPRHLKVKAGEYRPQYIYKYKLNEQGQEIEEFVTTEKDEFIHKKTTEYDSNNRILKTVMYSEMNKPDITHLYVYE